MTDPENSDVICTPLRSSPTWSCATREIPSVPAQRSCCLGQSAGTARGEQSALLPAERDELVLLASRRVDATGSEAGQSTCEGGVGL